MFSEDTTGLRRGVDKEKTLRKRKIRAICVGLAIVLVMIATYATHRVPPEAPFLTKTVCLAQDTAFQDYTLLIGVFDWQKQVRPRFGYVIYDEQSGSFTSWDQTLVMKIGHRYRILYADIHGNNASTPAATIRAI